MVRWCEVRDSSGGVRAAGLWRRATADWSQPQLPVSAAIDDDLQKGWAVLPFVQERHVAVFELAEPLTVGAEDTLIVRLVQKWGKRHLMSRFRLWITGDPLPAEHWHTWLLRPEAEQSPDELRRRDAILAQVPPVLRSHYQALIALGALRPQPPADLSSAWLTPGWYAISVNFLMGYPAKGWTGDGKLVEFGRSAFSYFQEFDPIATAGYSIYIYHITREDANRVRARYGLPQLPTALDSE